MGEKKGQRCRPWSESKIINYYYYLLFIYLLLLLLLLLLSSLLFEGVDHDLGQRRASALWAGIEVSF